MLTLLHSLLYSKSSWYLEYLEHIKVIHSLGNTKLDWKFLDDSSIWTGADQILEYPRDFKIS